MSVCLFTCLRFEKWLVLLLYIDNECGVYAAMLVSLALLVLVTLYAGFTF